MPTVRGDGRDALADRDVVRQWEDTVRLVLCALDLAWKDAPALRVRVL